MRLQDKVALITGANSSIGRAIALRFAREGANIILAHFQHEQEMAEIVNEIEATGKHALVIAADVRAEDQVQHMVTKAMNALKRIDILVNTAEADIFAAIGMDDEQKLQQVLDIDVQGTFLCCRAVIPLMQAQGDGCILNMSSDTALTEGAYGTLMTMYTAAKGAVHSLSMCLAQEVAPTIRVNVLAPGWIRTPMTAHFPDGTQSTIDSNTPMEGIRVPDDVAEAALYLASPETSYITGQTIVVNGGRIMY